MKRPRIVTRDDWQDARAVLLNEEKALTRAHDRLAAQRRRAPWMSVEDHYEFNGSDGRIRLVDLFDGRRQLIVYHHMLKPADPHPCVGCGMVGDQIPHLAHLRQRDTSMVFVSRAPFADIVAYRERMRWRVPWYETNDRFNSDFDVTGGFGLNVFFRDGDQIYRTYYTTGRGIEALGTVWSFLDLTPLGRQEHWEDSPEGALQTPPYEWWRLHDEYRD